MATTLIITNALLCLAILTALFGLFRLVVVRLPDSAAVPSADWRVSFTSDALLVEPVGTGATIEPMIRGMWSRPRELTVQVDALTEELARLHPDRGRAAARAVAVLVRRDLDRTEQVA